MNGIFPILRAVASISFMAIDLLDGGPDNRVPRLYRHDVESFVRVLAFITVASIDLKLKDRSDRDAYISSKRDLRSEYGEDQEVSGRYYCHVNVVQQILRHGSSASQNPLEKTQFLLNQKLNVDDPASSSKLFTTTVDKSLGEHAIEGFEAVKALLLEAVGTPTATAKALIP
ncbi:hypothetical protein BDM02DRAFT_3191308 [Thelephora ganbajun]|uniref:Uncharacterized protein n=1 Tax=Thelephora ganbajun TaxID=370292 RepID=A0ACB6Z257_THEGA|nr:hypothetical protein BDM02DRAFT_3191308 [Thelephora ganbajun]